MFEGLSKRLGDVFDKLRGRGALKDVDVAATTTPTKLPMTAQPLTASYYAIAVVKFDMLYLASSD